MTGANAKKNQLGSIKPGKPITKAEFIRQAKEMVKKKKNN